ncbi:MAG: glycine cleavage system aminomethyltransferase GcvT [Alphaproteobacteria bacterium]|nr:glycine cleavage system aminomethyltransferase GcvT [Alphaproteobacteria bacterium]MBT4083408.1 glycine cleavage system aminomethyltransferase GcvT [Alphaproteobacteria bacterium]MBT4542940.1 glycine cleavage system aminomethyltransferase GcvT [Alphaproteobacteria bacterium]MBT5920274.1 glycine cleavage system aminomethyltransferase GcvT [Alphaproteobacteria bacterium]MBT6384478.1 glycine cleavage system aminomethyltransferase GcvT [Alphaproteobacteria bacterium]
MSLADSQFWYPEADLLTHSEEPQADKLHQTPLDALHRELGARMVPFAGYDMPVQYPSGIIVEHKHTRAQAGLFDVSHMGQVKLHGADRIAQLESLVPGDIEGLASGGMRYSLFTNDKGGVLDDLMITRCDDHLFLVVNAGCKEADIAHLKKHLGDEVVEVLEDRALVALQGPAAVAVLSRLAPAAADLAFMSAAEMDINGIKCFVSRSGYTGEDGYEISVPSDQAETLARTLLAMEEVEPVGLGARDSLRLEAGLCLYGHDLDPETTPIEAALTWTIGKRRRQPGAFPGADIILDQIENKPARRRVGLVPEGRALAREGVEIVDADGTVVGTVTSGGFGPSFGGSIVMGYVQLASAAVDTELGLVVRGKTIPAKVVKMPFVAKSFAK